MRLVLLCLWIGCGGAPTPASDPTPPATPTPAPTPPAASAPAAPVPPVAPAPTGDTPRVVFLGDSLTAGLGVARDDAFPAWLGRALAAEGLPIEVVNAGVSGDTSAGGLRRADWVLGQKPDVLVLALGANDMLRGLPPEACKENLSGIVEKAKAVNADVLLLGMKSSPTLGVAYNAEFDAVYPYLRDTYHLPLVPFLLEGVAGEATLNQEDGLHPTPEGHARIGALVLPALEPLVRARARR